MKSLKLNLLLAAAIAFSATSYAGNGVPETYPLKKCPVSGEELGGHGKPLKVSDQGVDVWLCCKSCVKDFNKEPAKFTQMVKDAGPAK